jgi:salicylate 5-hydroxylase large subunit
MIESNVEAPAAPETLKWEGSGTSRIPVWVYTDASIYQKELERFFYSGHWSYVGLDVELPETGDFKLATIGERSVIVVRAADGSVNVLENACAHRGAEFCREQKGNKKDFTCPYHQWNYNLGGDLVGVPFRRGLKQDGKVLGGMPSDFDPKDHGLTKLKVARRNGVIFASFDHSVESLEDYLGEDVLRYYDRVFHGRKLKVHGYSRQRIPSNWKLVLENLKDPYHAGLLHTWFTTFGLYRGNLKSSTVMDKHARHSVFDGSRDQSAAAADIQSAESFKQGMTLHDGRILDVAREDWWGEQTFAILTMFPNLVVQQQSNSMTTRSIVPRGPDAFDFVFTHFGFDDDDETMTLRRLRMANLFGPAGYVWADDGEVLEYCQDGFHHDDSRASLVEQGGRGFENTDHTITEGMIRGMYSYWRKVMGV